MQCTFHTDGYRCDLGFSATELESPQRCVLHSDPADGTNWSESRTELIQNALNAVIDRRITAKRPLQLIGVVIPRNVSFGIKVLPGLIARNSYFDGGDHFASAKFSGNVELENCSFRSDTSFANSTFAGDIKFRGMIEKGLNFSKAIFGGNVDIKMSAQGDHGELNFNETQCAGNFIFVANSSIGVILELKNSVIKEQFRAEGTFKKGIDLSASRFEGKSAVVGQVAKGLIARHCTFSGDANFQKLVFSDELDFSQSRFMSRARFNGAFSGHADFSGCIFEKHADFSVANSADDKQGSFGIISFHDAIFRKEALFKNRQFLSTANFANCQFFIAPEFHGAILHQDIRFPRIEAFKDTATENAAAAYRTLRQAMEKNNARREEAMFYALEQKTLRSIPGAQTKWENFASAFYDRVSGYGVNFWRPLGWMGVVMLLSGIAYALWRSWPVALESSFDIGRLGDGLSFSVQQVVNPFWVWRASLPWKTDWPDALRLVATLQSLLTTGLFALSLLALRWRFKRE